VAPDLSRDTLSTGHLLGVPSENTNAVLPPAYVAERMEALGAGRVYVICRVGKPWHAATLYQGK
jgi:hypothetical protein